MTGLERENTKSRHFMISSGKPVVNVISLQSCIGFVRSESMLARRAILDQGIVRTVALEGDALVCDNHVRVKCLGDVCWTRTASGRTSPL